MSRRPFIGICARFHCKNGKGSGVVDIQASYVDAVEKAGGDTVLLPPVESIDLERHKISVLDALILPGGKDIKPSRYGQKKHSLKIKHCTHPALENARV